MFIGLKFQKERLEKYKAKQVRVLALKQYCIGTELCNSWIEWIEWIECHCKISVSYLTKSFSKYKTRTVTHLPGCKH